MSTGKYSKIDFRSNEWKVKYLYYRERKNHQTYFLLPCASMWHFIWIIEINLSYSLLVESSKKTDAKDTKPSYIEISTLLETKCDPLINEFVEGKNCEWTKYAYHDERDVMVVYPPKLIITSLYYHYVEGIKIIYIPIRLYIHPTWTRSVVFKLVIN